MGGDSTTTKSLSPILGSALSPKGCIGLGRPGAFLLLGWRAERGTYLERYPKFWTLPVDWKDLSAEGGQPEIKLQS